MFSNFFSNSKSKSPQGRSFRFEALERRDLMAGNVTASLVGGSLYINGDGAANNVVVSRLANGAVEVSGRASAGADTKINGVVGGRAQFTGITGNVTANMNSGNDEINFYGYSSTVPMVVPYDLVVQTQDGNDVVGMTNVRAGRDMLVNTGSGVDSFIGVTVATGANMYVLENSNAFYAGNSDFVNIYGNSSIGNQLQVRLNSGNDTFRLDRTFARSLYMNAGAGNDSIYVNQSTISTFVSIDAGMGSDNTMVQFSSIGDDLIVSEVTGVRSTSDYDRIGIVGNQVKDYIWVEGNRGREEVHIENSTADKLYASLGDGDDWLGIRGTTIRSTWNIQGGAGRDTLNRYGNPKTYGSNGFEYFSALYL